MDLAVVTRDPLVEGPAGGRTALLVHGAMDRSSSFGRVMSRLEDWRIVTYDRRGYGRSAAVGPSPDFHTQVQDLLGVIDSTGGGPVTAFGHSFGGDLVLAAMGARPECITSALVWEPPQPWRFPPGADSAPQGSPEDRAEAFMRRMIGDRIWERLPARTREQRRSEGPALVAEVASLGHGPVFDASCVRVPVLVGRGGKSRVHQRRSARELAADLPFGQLAEIADAEHGAHLSHPAEVAKLIRKAAQLSATERN